MTCSQTPCKQLAEVLCTDCDESFCMSCCEKLHKSAKGLQKHKIMPIDCNLNASIAADRCRTHLDNIMEFFCEECEVYVCCYCAIADHSGHRLSSVTQLVRRQSGRGRVRALARSNWF